MCRAIDHLHEQEGEALYSVRLVPLMWRLTQTRHSRVFVDRSVPEILAAVLASEGLGHDDFALRLQHQYPTREFVCQYQESDYAFLARWMEREGMYFYFEQGGARERLVITDCRHVHASLGTGPVRFRSRSAADDSTGEALSRFVCRRAALPEQVELRDYDDQNPNLELLVRETVSPGGHGELSTFGPNFRSESEGTRLAKLRAEELRAHATVFSGSGHAVRVAPCHTFELVEHLRADGHALFTADARGTVRAWDLSQETRTSDATDEGHLGPAYAVSFSNDGKLLASGGGDRTVRLWDVTTGAQRSVIHEPDEVTSLAFSHDGAYLAVASGSGGVRGWELASGMEVDAVGADLEGARVAALGPRDGVVAAAGAGPVVRIWDLVSETERPGLRGHAGVVRGLPSLRTSAASCLAGTTALPASGTSARGARSVRGPSTPRCAGCASLRGATGWLPPRRAASTSGTSRVGRSACSKARPRAATSTLPVGGSRPPATTARSAFGTSRATPAGPSRSVRARSTLSASRPMARRSRRRATTVAWSSGTPATARRAKTKM